MYKSRTRGRVERFLRRRRRVVQREVQYLGHSRLQIKFPTVKEILKDLREEGKVKLTPRISGKRKRTEVVWNSR